MCHLLFLGEISPILFFVEPRIESSLCLVYLSRVSLIVSSLEEYQSFLALNVGCTRSFFSLPLFLRPGPLCAERKFENQDEHKCSPQIEFLYLI